MNDSNTIQNHGIREYYVGDMPSWLDTYTAPQPKTRSVKKTTRTIEKYDPEGQLISREIIIDEEEIFEKQIWDNHEITVIGDGTTGGNFDGADCLTNDDVTSGSVTYKNNVPYTLTNGMGIGNIVANYDSPNLGEE